MTIYGWDPVFTDDCFVYDDEVSLFEMQEKLLALLKERWAREDRGESPLFRAFISTPRSKGWVHKMWERETSETSETSETREHGTPLLGKDE